jgi:RNA polymerase sigma-70 factor, ECF subfamily
VRAAQQGDRAALDALLRRHYDRLHAVCRRITGHDADALDATQEALLALARSIRTFDGRAAFTTWSYRIAVNAALDELRRRNRRPVVALPDHDGALAATADPLDDPERVSERLVLDEAIRSLPLEFRAAVVLRDLCALDYAEIAAILDIPPGTVRSRIARGRGQLARRLTGNPDLSTERPTT